MLITEYKISADEIFFSILKEKVKMKLLIILSVFICSLFSAIGVSIDCKFMELPNYGYICNVRYLKITSKLNRTLDAIFGEHLPGKTNNDVKFLDSINNEVNYLLLGVKKFLPNLIAVRFQNGNLMEITAADMAEYPSGLKKLWLAYNIIEKLPKGLFNSTPLIEELYLSGNKIQVVNRGVLTNLFNLKKIDFEVNPCTYGYADALTLVKPGDFAKGIEADCQDLTILQQERLESLAQGCNEVSSTYTWIDNNCRCYYNNPLY